MRELFKLGERLYKCAEFVREGKKVADIGTDHGYLPIWLVKSGKNSFVTASDVSEGPLSSCALNAKKYNVEINTVLSNGFENIDENDVDDCVIAGLGGEMIAQIIDRAQWLKNPQKHLILQPMTMPEKLRKYLFSKGFSIQKEELVLDEGRIYSVMLVKYEEKEHSLLEEYMGQIEPYSPFSEDYAYKIVTKLYNSNKGAQKEGDDEAYKMRTDLINKISDKYLR